MSRNIQIIAKWLPSEILEKNYLYTSCSSLEGTCINLLHRFEGLLNNLKDRPGSKFNPLVSENEMQITDIED
ncbi:hypothetical protein JTB14_003291 [Gonioctena quinquepunctata]|nr:hypothetical protein JTB14_003291 [Gonioctena quinquepunctata]